MAKFCGKCGAKLDEQGRCPKCNMINKPHKSSKKKNIIILLSIMAIIIVCIFGHKVEDVANNDQYTVVPPNAEEYFENNSYIVSSIEATKSNNVRTCEQVLLDFSSRGFDTYPITAEYSMNGDYYDAVEITNSSDKHPIYETFYITSTGDIWIVIEINGFIMANSVTYNYETGSSVQTIISEKNTVMSYDATTNTFYETIPNNSELNIKVVDKIDSKTLENLMEE